MTRISDLLDSDFSTPVADASDPARVLRKSDNGERILRQLFHDYGGSLIQNARLEGCSRRTEFNEDQFVRFYPYLPHLIDLSADIAAGIWRHPGSPKDTDGISRNIVRQCFEMLAPEGVGFTRQPAGALVSIDKIYELVEGDIPPRRRKAVAEVRGRSGVPRKYRPMAERVTRAVCLMEFVETNLPRSTNNIAALLIQHVSEAPAPPAVAEILHYLRESQFVRETEDGWTLHDFDKPQRGAATVERLRNDVGTVNPRLPGWHNRLIQLAKKGIARTLTWYTRPLNEFHASVSRLLNDIAWSLGYLSANMTDPERVAANTDAVDRLSADVVALERRLAQSEQRNAAAVEKLDALREQVGALISVPETGEPEQARTRTRFQSDTGSQTDRTAYIIGLFGSGRWYINELLLQHIGGRAGLFRDIIRLHPGPTSMIYSGHATVRYPSRLQYPPIIMSQILDAVGSRFADSVFIYRHPLDSLLTNWIWWRTFIRENRMIGGISEVFKNPDDLCAELDRNFSEFEAFAANDPAFFPAEAGPWFLSFAEFVEETELHLQAATLSLRLEDFSADPAKEFSKIAAVMSVAADPSRLRVAPPRTEPYRHLAVRDQVPRFRDFIRGLDAETKKRMEKMGYDVGS